MIHYFEALESLHATDSQKENNTMTRLLHMLL